MGRAEKAVDGGRATDWQCQQGNRLEMVESWQIVAVDFDDFLLIVGIHHFHHQKFGSFGSSLQRQRLVVERRQNP